MKIPLRNRNKITIGFAIVDESDYQLLSKHRWSLATTGYPQTWHNNHVRTMHQVILGLEPGYRRKDMEVEHLNQDKLDNRRSNLRVGTRQSNSRNQYNAQSNSTTGYLNVHKVRSGYYQVRIFGKYFGAFTDLDKAAEVAKKARLKELS